MQFSDEILMAYIDGELDESTRLALQAAMADDSRLVARIERYRALGSQLRAHFDPVLSEPIPARLQAAAQGKLIGMRQQAPRSSKQSLMAWQTWTALAAGLLLGVFLIAPQWRARSGPDVEWQGDQIVARGALSQVLSSALAGETASDASIRVGISFLSRSGEYCRSFTLQGHTAMNGLACHDSRGWNLQGLSALSGDPAEYRQASSSIAPAVAQRIDELISGEPLDAAGEALARSRGWSVTK